MVEAAATASDRLLADGRLEQLTGRVNQLAERLEGMVEPKYGKVRLGYGRLEERVKKKQRDWRESPKRTRYEYGRKYDEEINDTVD